VFNLKRTATIKLSRDDLIRLANGNDLKLELTITQPAPETAAKKNEKVIHPGEESWCKTDTEFPRGRPTDNRPTLLSIALECAREKLQNEGRVGKQELGDHLIEQGFSTRQMNHARWRAWKHMRDDVGLKEVEEDYDVFLKRGRGRLKKF